MSAEFERLVGHAVMNFDFCQGLLADTEATLAKGGFVLSEAERTQLLNAITQDAPKPEQVPGRAW